MEQVSAQHCATNVVPSFNNVCGESLATNLDNGSTGTPHSMVFARLVGFVPSLLFRVIGFVTITLPLFFYHILTWSFTLHLNFSSLVMVLVVVGLVGYHVVRYRFLNTYSRLKPVNSQKATSSFDLHPDSGEDSGYSKPSIRNYPDEFLSAFLSSIKIFGYLEQPVFHELARHLQTKKLLAGDTLFQSPEQERSFYIVVDGHVQLFVKPDGDDVYDYDDDGSSFGLSDTDESTTNNSNSSDGDGEFSGSGADPWANKKRRTDKFKHYTLINEVGQGGTLSSLFTILSIFRESFNRTELKHKTKNKSMRHQIASRSSSTQQQHGGPAEVSPDMRRDTSSDEWRHVFPNLENQAGDASLPISASSSAVATPTMSPKDDPHRRRRLSSFGSSGHPGSRKHTRHLYTTPMKLAQGKFLSDIIRDTCNSLLYASLHRSSGWWHGLRTWC
jgi:lysophospholipid hydrolase